MNRIPRLHWRCCRGIFLGGLLVISSRALQPPSEQSLNQLQAESFQHRQEAQAAILKWARTSPAEAKSWLLKQAYIHPEPECRRRLMGVLRELVIDDYLRDGEGYVGVLMAPTIRLLVPGDPKERAGVPVTMIVPGGAAANAGVQVGDVLVEVDGVIWREQDATEGFSRTVRGKKPGEKVNLKLVRQGQLVTIGLVLARRPPDRTFLLGVGGAGPTPEELAREEEAAKNEYFRDWLEKMQKTGK